MSRLAIETFTALQRDRTSYLSCVSSDVMEFYFPHRYLLNTNLFRDFVPYRRIDLDSQMFVDNVVEPGLETEDKTFPNHTTRVLDTTITDKYLAVLAVSHPHFLCCLVFDLVDYKLVTKFTLRGLTDTFGIIGLWNQNQIVLVSSNSRCWIYDLTGRQLENYWIDYPNFPKSEPHITRNEFYERWAESNPSKPLGLPDLSTTPFMVSSFTGFQDGKEVYLNYPNNDNRHATLVVDGRPKPLVPNPKILPVVYSALTHLNRNCLIMGNFQPLRNKCFFLALFSVVEESDKLVIDHRKTIRTNGVAIYLGVFDRDFRLITLEFNQSTKEFGLVISE